MSKAKYDLSVTQRLFLDYVKFKTHNNIPFFMGNEKIADALDLTVNTAKIMVNNLVRGGYINKEKDKNGRRVLSLTLKEYKPLFEDLRNIDKKLLKSERDYYKNDAEYYEQQYKQEEAHCEQLLRDNDKLNGKNFSLTQKIDDLTRRVNQLEIQCGQQDERIKKLESVFLNYGITSQQIEEILQSA